MKEVEYISIRDIRIFLKQIFVFAFKKWKVLLFFGFMGGVFGYVYASFQKPVYHAKLSFLLNENEQTPSLNLSSLAGLAGISGGSNNGNVNEEKLLFIANSRYLLGTAILQEAQIAGSKKMMVNHYIDIFNLTGSFKSDTGLQGFTYFTHNSLEDLTYGENKVMDRILKEITEGRQFTVDSKKRSGIVSQGSGIIILEYKSLNELFAKNFIEILYENLSKYYTNKTIQRQLKNYALIKGRSDSIREVLYTKENYQATLSDNNIGLIRMQGRIEMERTKREIEMLSLMYGEIMKNLEVARFALDNQTPVFQLIDNPTFPLEKKKVSRLNTTVICVILASILAFFWIVFRNFKMILIEVQNEIVSVKY